MQAARCGSTSSRNPCETSADCRRVSGRRSPTHGQQARVTTGRLTWPHDRFTRATSLDARRGGRRDRFRRSLDVVIYLWAVLDSSLSKLPPIFADANICTLDGFVFRKLHTPPRTVGRRREASAELSAMTTRQLRVRLDGVVHGFITTKNNTGVRYTGENPQPSLQLDSCPPHVVTVRRIYTTPRELTLLLIDETIGKAIAVIGETLTWNLAGINVQFTGSRGELHEL